MRALLLLLLAAVLLPMLALQTVLYWRGFAMRRDAALEANRGMAAAAAANFITFARNVGREEMAVGAALALSGAYPNGRAATALLTDVSRGYPSVRAYSWASPEGTVTASSEPQEVGATLVTYDFFARALAAPDWVVSDVLSPGPGEEISFFIARAYRDDTTAEVLGVVTARIEPRELARATLNLGKPGRQTVLLADKRGVVACVSPFPVRTLDLKRASALRNRRLVVRALAGRASSGMGCTISGANEAVAWVPIEGVGWIAGAAAPASSVLGPLWHQLLGAIGANVLVLAASLALALVISRRIRRGVRGLEEHARALNAGALDHRAEVHGVAEIDTVASSLDQMAAERARMEDALRASEQRLRDVVDTANAAFYVCDLDGRFLVVNRYFEQLARRGRKEIEGKTADELFDPEIARRLTGRDQELLDTGGPIEMEEPLERQDGTHYYLNQKFLLHDATGEPYAISGIGTDITRLKRAEEALLRLNQTLEQRVAERTAEAAQRAAQLQELAARLVHAEHQERSRLAVVLHDHLQQILVSARFVGGGLRRRLTTPESHAEAEKLDGLLRDAIEATRSLTAELSPPVLHQSGLPIALEWLAEWMEDKHGLRVDHEIEQNADPTDEETRVLLFTAVRELLFNVVKHAGVLEAKLRLRRLGNERLEAVVADLGSGMDTSRRPHPGAGTGLASLRERLELMGGALEVDSAPGHGTRATVTVPLRRAGTPLP